MGGSLSATEFVAWYNGHPDYRHLNPDLSGEQAVVVGAGNVAVDVARILMRTEAALARTDIADHALERLASSNIKRVTILVRRGPAQAKFTPTELKELVELDDVDIIINPAVLDLDPASAQQAMEDKRVQRNLEHLRASVERPRQEKEKQIHFRFLTSPVSLIGSEGKVDQIEIEQNQLVHTKDGWLTSVSTGKTETICADLVLRSVGYRGIPLPDVPFDEQRSTIPNEKGRVLNQDTALSAPREYVVGWAKRGPSGVIGTNKPDAAETVQQMLADLPNLEPVANQEPTAIEQLLNKRNIRFINLAQWQRIDESEQALGQQQDRPRVKMTSLAQIREFVDPAHWS